MLIYWNVFLGEGYKEEDVLDFLISFEGCLLGVDWELKWILFRSVNDFEEEWYNLHSS